MMGIMDPPTSSGGRMGRLSPKVGPKQEQITEEEGCDRCGYSRDGIPLQIAMYRIRTRNGVLFLCGHHTRLHWADFIAKGYGVELL